MANINYNSSSIGLRQSHFEEFFLKKPKLTWVEVHTENFFTESSKLQEILNLLKQYNYRISFHGVGLSLGSADDVCYNHLEKIKVLVDEYDPLFVSEHLSWSKINGIYLPDLFPLPYTKESLHAICKNIHITQNYLGRKILIENPSTYIEFQASSIGEEDFLNEICRITGCGILLDINNIYVSSINHRNNPYDYLNRIKSEYVKEIHLAGHTEVNQDDKKLLIDTHDNKVALDVWELYEYFIRKNGKKPTLVEWDQDLPSIDVLLDEAFKAESIMSPKKHLKKSLSTNVQNNAQRQLSLESLNNGINIKEEEEC